jgi:hypothetical protein
VGSLTFGQTLLTALLGTWFGLLHSLDADHLATLGGLAVNSRTMSATGYALRWAVGHAAALATIAVAVLGLDDSGLLHFTGYGDVAIGAVLLMIGSKALVAAARCPRESPGTAAVAPTSTELHLRGERAMHVHFFAPFHTHSRSGLAGVAIGLLHGGGGSAAVLALLPLTRLRSGLEDALYLACFSLGVGAGALVFAKFFAGLVARAANGGAAIATAFRAAVGLLAVGTGAALLIGIGLSPG